jgi:hypothetical protein
MFGTWARFGNRPLKRNETFGTIRGNHLLTPLEKHLENLTWMIGQARQAGIKPMICSMRHCVETERKNDKIGARQVDLAWELNKAGLLSDKGLKAVLGPSR